MNRPKNLRLTRAEEDEGMRQKKKYEETLKVKKDLLKQEFDHLEEIRKLDELSVQTLNEVKFKHELDSLGSLRKQRMSVLDSLRKKLQVLQAPDDRAQNTQHQMSQSSGFQSMVNNHHSDQLYSTFRKNISIKTPEQYQEYLSQLRAEEERYKYLIETEDGKTEALETNLQKVIKSNIYFQQEIQEMKVIKKVADNRFSNIEAVQFLAAEKQTTCHKNLKSIKAELRDIQEIRKNFRKKQHEKQREYKKEIQVGEEYVSHNGMKIEEAEFRNAELEREIQYLEQEEKRILEKRQKSQNISQYIELFNTFERLFLNPADKPSGSGVRLVDKYVINEELLYQLRESLQEDQRTQIEKEEQEDFDRENLRLQITEFFSTHADGPMFILKFMIEKFWQLTAELKQSNQTYEDLLKQKSLLKAKLQMLDRNLHEMLSINQYLQNETHEHMTIKQRELKEEVEQIEGIVDEKDNVAYDAGLFVSHLARGQDGFVTETKTLNIFKIELDEITEIKNLTAKNLKSQNILFNFYLSFSHFMYRSAQTLQMVIENSSNTASLDIAGQIHNITQYCEQIWTKTQQQTQKRRESKIPKKTMAPSNQLRAPQTISLIQSAFSGQTIEEEPIQFNEQISLHQIGIIFREVFLSHHQSEHVDDHLENLLNEASEYFYQNCKQDQLIWLLISPLTLKAFLQNLKKSNHEYFHKNNRSKLTLNILLPSYQIANLRQELVQQFCSQFHALLQFYQQLDIKLRELCMELKIYLKEKDPKFDPNRINVVQLKDGFMIAEARQMISQKIDLYRTGEIKVKPQSPQTHTSPSLAKVLGKAVEKIQPDSVKVTQSQEVLPTHETLLQKVKDKLSEDELQYLKEFYHSQLHQKYEPVIPRKKSQDDIKKQLQNIQDHSERDEFDEERDLVKDNLQSLWTSQQEQLALRSLIPQIKEEMGEKKAQIKDVTLRLYGEPGETAQILKNMSVTTGILSDIDKLEKQPSPIEQPFLISNFKLQKKNIYNQLNKETSLPTLHFLKPTSAYISRRQQSQEQILAMQQKRYDLIESGMAINSRESTAPRPPTEGYRKRTTKQSTQADSVIPVGKLQTNFEKFYQRYGSHEQSQQFLGYLMNKNEGQATGQSVDTMTLQDMPFQFSNTKSVDTFKNSASGRKIYQHTQQ